MSQIGTQLGNQLDLSALQPLTPAVSGSKPAPGKLAHAAVEFESVLLGQWLQSAEKSFATVPGSEDTDDPQGEQMMSFAMQHLAHSIAGKGAFGIAQIVQAGLEHASASTTSSQPSSASSAKLPSTP